MNTPLCICLASLLVCASYGQGSVLFGNRVTGAVDAPVLNGVFASEFSGPVDSRFYAQLYAGPVGAPLQAVGDPVPFWDTPSNARGYFQAVERRIPEVPPGSPAQVKVVAWYRGLADSYAEAQARGQGGVGESAVIRVDQTGGGVLPPTLLVGLQGFSIGNILGFVAKPNAIVGSGFPNDPQGVHQSFDFLPPLERVQGIATTESVAFVASGYGGLRTFDVRDPARIQLLSYLLLDHTMARGVAVTGRHAYVALSDFGGGGPGVGLRLVEVGDPTHPEPVSRVSLSGEPKAVCLTPDGRFAMVSAGAAGLHVVDVQDPAAPQVSGRYDSGGEAHALALAGTVGYLAAGSAGLHILDLANPAQPVRLGLFSTSDAVLGVASGGTVAYVSSQDTGLRVVDVTEPTAPREVGLVLLPGGAGASILVGRHVYVQNPWSAPNAPEGVSVVDVSDSAHPRVVGRSTVAKGANGFAFSEGQLWVADTVGLTGFPLGPVLHLARHGSLGITGTLGQPYEIQERAALAPGSAWTRVMEVIPTQQPQAVELPPSTAAANRFLRAIALP